MWRVLLSHFSISFLTPTILKPDLKLAQTVPDEVADAAEVLDEAETAMARGNSIHDFLLFLCCCMYQNVLRFNPQF